MAWSRDDESLEESIQELVGYHQVYLNVRCKFHCEADTLVCRETHFNSTVSSSSILQRPLKLNSSNDDETTSSDDSESTGAASGEEGTLPPCRKNRMLNHLQRRFYGNGDNPGQTSGGDKVTLNEALPGYSTGLMPAVYQTTDTSDTFHKEGRRTFCSAKLNEVSTPANAKEASSAVEAVSDYVTNNSNVDDRKLGSLLTSEKSKWVKSVLQAVVPIPTLVDKIREAIGHG
uniref:Expressed conserved protein n=1 Tax=Echinococcus granulosus TaxID=6210 RepID=A0A068WXT5_ECHGR|nr:hypothetical protein EgrG_000293800 [Echinococcus granulosus]